MQANLSLTLDNGIVLRPAASVADYRGCQEAQRKAWGIIEDGYLVPIATMVGAQLHGGLVLGAFSPEGETVAMSFAFLGRIHGQLCLYSQLTGVIPGFQSHGLGYQIKLMQRRFAIAESIPTIAWAFDPLQAGNARFNLDKLGATSSRFIENMYGVRTDRLNLGVSTDRLIAEWPATLEPHSFVPDRQAPLPPSMIPTKIEPDGTLIPVGVDQDFSSSRLSVPIPSDIAALRRDRPELAESWRVSVRDAFKAAFAVGYRAIGFLREPHSLGGPGAYYILERTPV